MMRRQPHPPLSDWMRLQGIPFSGSIGLSGSNGLLVFCQVLAGQAQLHEPWQPWCMLLAATILDVYLYICIYVYIHIYLYTRTRTLTLFPQAGTRALAKPQKSWLVCWQTEDLLAGAVILINAGAPHTTAVAAETLLMDIHIYICTNTHARIYIWTHIYIYVCTHTYRGCMIRPTCEIGVIVCMQKVSCGCSSRVFHRRMLNTDCLCCQGPHELRLMFWWALLNSLYSMPLPCDSTEILTASRSRALE